MSAAASPRRNNGEGGASVPPFFLMRIFVDQRAISRNAGRQDDEQEPVFIVEGDNGERRTVHAVHFPGPATLRYDRTRDPRAWIEADNIREGQ